MKPRHLENGLIASEAIGASAGGGSEADEYFRWVSLQGGSLEAGDGTYRVS